MNDVKFSIIIPCYKVEKYIRECLDSVLAQTCGSWEAICVDDGSPDGTGTVLDAYAARYGEGRRKIVERIEATRAIPVAAPADEMLRRFVKGYWDGDAKIIREIVDWGGRIVPDRVENVDIGEIRTFRNSIRSILHHTRFRGPLKVLVLQHLGEILRKAVLFDKGHDGDETFYNLAHRMSFDPGDGQGEREFVARIIVRETADGNRTWTVEFSNKKELTGQPTTGKVATLKVARLKPPSTHTILKSIYTVKGLIRVIHQKNQGLSAARNAALDQATGEWLLYLDSDDVLSPWALETYVRMAEKYPQADILRAGMVKSADGKWHWGMADGASTGMDVQGRITTYGLGGYFVRMAYKRSVHGDIRFVGKSWCEERPYVAKCLARANFVTDTPVVAYGFRVREGSITHRKMTPAEWKGFLWATMDIAKTFQASGRHVDPGVARLVMLVWMEKQVFFLCTHLRPEERREAWNVWFDSLDDLGCGLAVAPWFRFARAVCRLTKSRAVAWCLCYLPHWLKEKGLHR